MESNRRDVKRKYIIWILCLTFIDAGIFLLCLAIGSINFPLEEIIGFIFRGNGSETMRSVIFEIRFPRTAYAMLIGGGLSICGAVLQTLLRNPLAEPYILGISSGAAFGALLSLLLGLSIIFMQLFSFFGALSVIILVFFIGMRFGEISPNIMILSGVMVGAFFSAAILIVTAFLGDSLRSAVFWLMGNIGFADSRFLIFIAMFTFVAAAIFIALSNKYNILTLGSENAKSLGINVSLIKNISYFLTSVLTGVLVSTSGIIGFVGLLIPHTARLLFGPDNRIVIPASLLLGAGYLAAADLTARTIIAPAELPIGSITAIFGAPAFIALLKKRFSSFQA